MFALQLVIKIFVALVVMVSSAENNATTTASKNILGDCDFVNSCSSGMYYCPDSGKLELVTSWIPTPYNSPKCATENNQISFDIVVSNVYSYANVTQIGVGSGTRTISLNCNSGMPYYQYLRNQKNSDWDCTVTLKW